VIVNGKKFSEVIVKAKKHINADSGSDES